MSFLEKMQHAAALHPKFVEVIRVILGVILIWKGVFFIFDLNILYIYLEKTGINNSLGISVLINLVARLIIVLNLLGGICIALNIQTRFFCWLNLPILFGAVFLINMTRGSFEIHTEFCLSLASFLATVFILLIKKEALQHHHSVHA